MRLVLPLRCSGGGVGVEADAVAKPPLPPPPRGLGSRGPGRNQLWAGWRVSEGSARPTTGGVCLLGGGVRRFSSWCAGKSVQARWGLLGVTCGHHTCAAPLELLCLGITR